MRFKQAELGLCTYDLVAGLGDSPEQHEQQLQQFLDRLAPELDRDLVRKNLVDYPDAAFLLLAASGLTQAGDVSHSACGETGFYYPVRIEGDCFALLQESERKDITVKDLAAWQRETAELLKTTVRQQLEVADPSRHFMGQTWLFSAVLADECGDMLGYACDCYQALRGGAADLGAQFGCQQWSLRDGGIWFVFQEQQHEVWIRLYSDQEALQAANRFGRDLLVLWQYHHKINWAVSQVRYLKGGLKKLAARIRKYRQSIRNIGKQDFDQGKLKEHLNRSWQDLLDCQVQLRLLDDQRRTVEINRHNYQAQLQQLGRSLDADVQALVGVREAQYRHIYQQINYDYANLKPEQAILESLITHIQTLIALEDTRLQSRLNQRIAIWGSALTLGAIVASISGQFPLIFGGDKWLQSILFSVGAALGLGGLIWFWGKIISKM